MTQWIAPIVAAKVLCGSASFSRSCIVGSSVSGAPDNIILSQLMLLIPQIFSDNQYLVVELVPAWVISSAGDLIRDIEVLKLQLLVTKKAPKAEANCKRTFKTAVLARTP